MSPCGRRLENKEDLNTVRRAGDSITMEPKYKELAQHKISDPELNPGPTFSQCVAFVLTSLSLRNADNPTSPWPRAILTWHLTCTIFHPPRWKDEKELRGNGTGLGGEASVAKNAPQRQALFRVLVGKNGWAGVGGCELGAEEVGLVLWTVGVM